MKRWLATLASSAMLFGCGNNSTGRESDSLKRDIAKAEAFVDAFYSFDPSRLGALLDRADKTKPDILFYQGWAEGGNYKIVKRMPCTSVGANTIACPITVDDDLINALGIKFDVTDTFTLTFERGDVVSVETSSNDPPEFHAAEEWVKSHRPELIEATCGSNFSSKTPSACVKAMVQGYKEFEGLQQSAN